MTAGEHRAGRTAGEAIAITGLGAVSGYGAGTAALWKGLASGTSAIGPFSRFEHARFRTQFASEAGEPAATAGPARSSIADRFALAAAREALAQAGLPSQLDDLSCGIYFGSSTGGMFESESYFADLLGEPRRASRIGRLTAQQTCSPGETVARAHGVRGPVQTVASACASATLAMGNALAALRAGDIDVAIAGGSDSLCRLTYAGFNSLRAVDPKACRPFRAEREGMSIGEGAAVLVLESAASASARGARVLGWLVGAGASCDAHHMTAPDPQGAGIARAVEAALADASLSADDIDFVNVHGTGTPHNDAAEANMLRAVFGERLSTLPLTSSKGAIGHYLGAAGAIEAVATMLCFLHGAVHPTPGEGAVDPAMNLDLVIGRPRPVPGARFALSTNLAFGGTNAAIILGSGQT
ncbi:MAG: beta-ketoacyl-[acyl-carrier-protein] synthase family protein [Thermoanaerobaculia bacterium]